MYFSKLLFSNLLFFFRDHATFSNVDNNSFLVTIKVLKEDTIGQRSDNMKIYLFLKCIKVQIAQEL